MVDGERKMSWQDAAREFSFYHYKEDGDIGGPRNLEWARREIFLPYDKEFRVGTSVLDVGSGNGRFNQMLKNYFARITNVDVAYPPDKQFIYPNTIWYTGDFVTCDFSEKYDMITFFFSLFIMPDKDAVVEKCLENLKDDGVIFVAECVTWHDVTRVRKEVYNIERLAKEHDLSMYYYTTKAPQSQLTFMRRR